MKIALPLRTAALQAAAAVLILAAIGAPARAADTDDEETRTETVTSAGLDLATRAGADQLQHRIQLAAERACRWDDDKAAGTAADDDFRLCVERAVKGVQPWMDTRIAEARTTELARAAKPLPAPGAPAEALAGR